MALVAEEVKAPETSDHWVVEEAKTFEEAENFDAQVCNIFLITDPIKDDNELPTGAGRCNHN